MPCNRQALDVRHVLPVCSLVACFLAGSALGGTQVPPGSDPDKDGQATSHIQELWSATLKDYARSTNALNAANVPRVSDLLDLEGPSKVVTLYAGGKLLILDADSGGIKHAFDVPAPPTVIKPRRLTDFLVSYVEDKSAHLSRIDTSSGKAIWTTKNDFRHVLSDGEHSLFVPWLWSELPDERHISVLAISGPPGQLLGPDLRSSLAIIDLETGAITREAKHDFRRAIKGSLVFFYSAKDRRFEVYDLKTGRTMLSGTTLEEDIKLPVGVVQFPGLPDTEVTPILTDTQLIITSRRYALGRLITSYDVKASWVKFDLQGNRLGRIEPAPKSAGDFLIKSVGSQQWPMIVGNFSKGSQYSYCQLDHFWQITASAEITAVPLPKIPGKNKLKLRPNAWFHNDSHMFALIDGSLHKWAIGSTESSAIYTSPKGTVFEDVVAADSKYAVLARYKDAVLVRLEDGRVVDPKDFHPSLGTSLWRQAADLKRSHSDLPREGGSGQFKKHVPFRNKGREGDAPSYVGYAFARVWGDFTQERGDIVLAPCLLKDGSARLVGIGIPEQGVLFSVPILGLKGVVDGAYEDGYHFPFGLFTVDETHSLLVVFEDPQQVRAYRVSRP